MLELSKACENSSSHTVSNSTQSSTTDLSTNKVVSPSSSRDSTETSNADPLGGTTDIPQIFGAVNSIQSTSNKTISNKTNVKHSNNFKQNGTCRKRKMALLSGGKSSKKQRRIGIQTSVENTFATIPITCRENDFDIMTFLRRIKQEVKEIVLEELARRIALKFNITVNLELQRISTDGDVQLASPYLHSRPAVVLYGTDLDAEIENAYARLTDFLECFQENGSGFTLSRVASCVVNVVTFDNIGGSSFIELPLHVKSKRACVNIKNEDSNCFQYSLLYVRKPVVQAPNRVYHYKKRLGELNMTGIGTPVQIKQIPRFELQNSDISVNVYGLLGKSKKDRKNKVRLYPMYTSPHRNRKYHANLLLLKDKNKAHHVVIKSLSRLLDGRTTYKNKMYSCRFCLYSFTKKDFCTVHEEVCSQIPAQVVSYPDECNKYLKFKTLAMAFALLSQFTATFTLFWFQCKMTKSERSIDTYQLQLVALLSQTAKNTTKNRFGFILVQTQWRNSLNISTKRVHKSMPF